MSALRSLQGAASLSKPLMPAGTADVGPLLLCAVSVCLGDVDGADVAPPA